MYNKGFHNAKDNHICNIKILDKMFNKLNFIASTI